MTTSIWPPFPFLRLTWTHSHDVSLTIANWCPTCPLFVGSFGYWSLLELDDSWSLFSPPDTRFEHSITLNGSYEISSLCGGLSDLVSGFLKSSYRWTSTLCVGFSSSSSKFEEPSNFRLFHLFTFDFEFFFLEGWDKGQYVCKYPICRHDLHRNVVFS